MAKKHIDSEVLVTESNDPRSYRLDSSKLIKTGFKKNFSVEMGINELIEKYNSGDIVENDSNYTVKWMKMNNI